MGQLYLHTLHRSVFHLTTFSSTDRYLLAVMANDCRVAVRQSLLYVTITTQKAHLGFVLGTCVFGVPL